MCVDDNNNSVPATVVVAPANQKSPKILVETKQKPVQQKQNPPPPAQFRPERIKLQRFKQPEWIQFRREADNFPEDNHPRHHCSGRLASFLFRRSSRLVWQIP